MILVFKGNKMEAVHSKTENSVLDGFARYTIDLEDESIVLKTKKLYCSSEKCVNYSDLAPGYILAKIGGLYGFPFLCYCIFFSVICNLLWENVLQEYALILSGLASASVFLGLVLFIGAHIRINKRAVFSYRDGGIAFRLKAGGSEYFLQELCARIDRAHSHAAKDKLEDIE